MTHTHSHVLARAIIALAVGVGTTPALKAAAIAHWTFNNSQSGATANGDVYNDTTGAHNATIVLNGTGAVNSGPGQFGNGITFNNASGAQATNNAYLSFPNLTELMGASGGDYSFAAWFKTNNGASNNPIVADWGNAAANTRRFDYWFSVNNSSGSGRVRGQARAANTPVDPANIDIYARQLGTGNSADDVWHHAAWTWNKSSKILTTYLDGVLAESFTSTATSVDLMVSDSPIGTIGRKADTNNYFVGSLDEIWIFNSELSASAVAQLKNTNAIPEPSALALAGLVIGALGVVARRRH